jgi:hypothetical protein
MKNVHHEVEVLAEGIFIPDSADQVVQVVHLVQERGEGANSALNLVATRGVLGDARLVILQQRRDLPVPSTDAHGLVYPFDVLFLALLHLLSVPPLLGVDLRPEDPRLLLPTPTLEILAG